MTIRDVAARAGVAVSTVSKYINGGHVREENRAAIQAAIEALDFRVNPNARSLKTQRSRSVGVLLPNMTAPFYGAMVTSLDRVLRAKGYHTLISCYGSNHGLERDHLRFLLHSGVDGLVYVPENLTPEEYAELTSTVSIPVVLADRSIAGVAADTVLADNTEIVYQAVTHLIVSGHRRIGILSGPASVFTAKERLVGYLRALSDHAILYDDSLVYSGDNTFITGYQGLMSLMNQPQPPTAVFSTNYDITVGSITAARELGCQIPQQLSIFGYDCVETCRMMVPPLPVIRQPEQELGALAGEYLLERLSGNREPSRITRLRCELIL